MAIWQHDLRIVPRDGPSARGLRPGEKLPVRADRESWWAGYTLPSGLLEFLASKLPRVTSWAEGWDVFGQEDGNRIDVICERGQLEEIKARLDARQADERFLDELVSFAKFVNGVFLTPDLRVLEPSLFAIEEELANSAAAAFVKNQKHEDRDTESQY